MMKLWHHLSHSSFVGYLPPRRPLRVSSFNNSVVHWFLISAALGLLSSHFVPSCSCFLGCDEQCDTSHCSTHSSCLSVIYYLINHRGCFLLTTQWFTDSCLQPLLGCCQVISSLCPLAFWNSMNNRIRLIVQRFPVVLLVIYCLVDHWGSL